MGEFELLQMVPHTPAKHLLLKLYLDRWFPVLGKYHERINSIDGFAGQADVGLVQAGRL